MHKSTEVYRVVLIFQVCHKFRDLIDYILVTFVSKEMPNSYVDHNT